MFVGWTRPGIGVHDGLDDNPDGPVSVRGTLMDYEEVQLAGDGELFVKSPYPTYRPEDTRVIKYVLSPEPVPVRLGWMWMHTAREAREHCTQRFGTILEENAAGDHVFFRVFKERK